ETRVTMEKARWSATGPGRSLRLLTRAVCSSSRGRVWTRRAIGSQRRNVPIRAPKRMWESDTEPLPELFERPRSRARSRPAPKRALSVPGRHRAGLVVRRDQVYGRPRPALRNRLGRPAEVEQRRQRQVDVVGKIRIDIRLHEQVWERDGVPMADG